MVIVFFSFFDIRQPNMVIFFFCLFDFQLPNIMISVFSFCRVLAAQQSTWFFLILLKLRSLTSSPCVPLCPFVISFVPHLISCHVLFIYNLIVQLSSHIIIVNWHFPSIPLQVEQKFFVWLWSNRLCHLQLCWQLSRPGFQVAPLWSQSLKRDF